jgi:hypothetical protein
MIIQAQKLEELDIIAEFSIFGSPDPTYFRGKYFIYSKLYIFFSNRKRYIYLSY